MGGFYLIIHVISGPVMFHRKKIFKFINGVKECLITKLKPIMPCITISLPMDM